MAAEERRRKDKARILEAIRAQDRIADTLAQRYRRAWRGTDVIRYWRDHRHFTSRSR